MVKVFMGLPGSGKTKHLIDLVNNAVENESGNVVCIELGQKLRFDLNHNAKLVDITEYDFQGSFETLTAFVSGMYAGNYDITHIFIASPLKLAGAADRRKRFGAFPRRRSRRPKPGAEGKILLAQRRTVDKRSSSKP